MRLKDKVAIVTGGASGVGAATARCFAREGAVVIVADILEAEGRIVESSIRDLGGTALFLKLDVKVEDDWNVVIARTTAEFGRLDILVNNAGLSGGAGIDVFELEIFDRLMAVNARGTFLGVRAAVPLMRTSGGGSIVNISSTSGVVGQNGIHAGYAASKGAVRTLTKSAAVQLGKDKIRVNSVHPGLLPPMRTSIAMADPETRKKLLPLIPLGRAGEPEEIAKAVLFLASDESSYVTGVELYVDGGFLAA